MQDTFQITEIIIVIEAIIVMLEKNTCITNLYNSHKIHNVCKSICPVC